MRICIFLATFFVLVSGCVPRSKGPAGSVDERTYVEDPYQHVLSTRSYGASLIRFYLDLNGDGEGELFAACSSDAGTGGNTYQIYQRTEKGYGCIGELGLKFIGISEVEKEGFHDLMVWIRLGGTEGNEYGPLITYRWNGKRYVEVSKEQKKLREIAAFDDKTHEYSFGKEWKKASPVEYCADYRGGNREWMFLYRSK